MKIIKGFPPNYDRIKKEFNPAGTVVFTYGDTVYAPLTGTLSPDLMAHEAVHIRQQVDPDKWWDRYFKDVEFRLEQETEAYRAQYKKFRKMNKFKKERKKFLERIASDLSSHIYGNCITFDEAIERIKDGK